MIEEKLVAGKGASEGTTVFMNNSGELLSDMETMEFFMFK